MKKRYFVTNLKILLCMLCLAMLAGCANNRHKVITHLEDKYDEEFVIYGAEKSILGEESAFVVQAVDHDNMPFDVRIEDGEIYDFYKERLIGKQVEDLFISEFKKKHIHVLVECNPLILNSQRSQLAKDSRSYNYKSFPENYAIRHYGVRIVLEEGEHYSIEDVMDVIKGFYNQVNYDTYIRLSVANHENYNKLKEILDPVPSCGSNTVQKYIVKDEIVFSIDNKGISMPNEDISKEIGLVK